MGTPLVVHNVTVSPSATVEGLQRFVVPWLTFAEVASAAYLLALAAIVAPPLRAARLPPPQALRASE